ncbi:SDR family oxidoreductase [Larkinella punicea]|uniref:SDR family NAD(P)-dependent oxidoreductase n=1 Tax=Larkinella punicea TaxID=2315727 RepID=A0A368JU22_9BACT|nr:SDR family oxidoreductase [Larkinella punicea]RCR71169.1 SDR family NAD(P)-dependent oxidoreductase [Larkinella punicea]
MHINDLFNLTGKVSLVTGGAGNYGKCIVEGLAEAGSTVITASRNLAAGQEVANQFQERGLDVFALPVDQGDPASVQNLKTQIQLQFGKLDVFVNNAVSRPMKGYDAPLSDFAESMRVNATGSMDILREMADLIVENGGGSIINIGSMMGMFGPDLSNYEGTTMGNPPPDYFFHNAGLLNLTKYMAQILAGKNVRVNCVSPGGLFNHQPERFLENYTKKVPLRRMANQDDIKGLIVLLASEAGAYINGENILMDGGLNA